MPRRSPSASWDNHPNWPGLLNSGSDVDDHHHHHKSAVTTQLLPPLPPPPGKKREAEEVKSGGVAESSDHEIHIWTERERRKKMRNMFANLHALLPHLPAKADKSTIVDEAVNYIKTLQQTLQKLHKQKLERLQNNNNNNNYYDPHLCSSSSKLVVPSQSSTSAREASSSNDMSSSAAHLLILSNNNKNNATTITTPTPNHINIIPPPLSSSSAFHTWTSSNLVLSVSGADAHFCVCSPKKSGLFATLCYVLDKHKIHVLSAHVSSDFHRSLFMIQAHADEFGVGMVAEEIFKQAAGEIIFWLSS